jgi:hypothetical protein
MEAKSTNRCKLCGVEKDVKEFNKDRNQCIPCKNSAQLRKASASYVAFCRLLFTNCKCGHKSRRKKVADLEFRLVAEDIVKLWEKQDGKCALTGLFLTHHRDGSGYKEHNASIDRINPAVGYTPENIQLVCFRINIMKHSLTEDMFYWWVKTINNFSCD